MDKLTKQEFGRIETTSLPSTFSFCFLSFFTFPTTSSTKSSEFSRQHFQLRLLWSNNCELHAMLHCWQLYCFMFDILTVWGEWYYPPVMQRTEENNAGTFGTGRKMNLLLSCEKQAFCFKLWDLWISSPSHHSELFWPSSGQKGAVTFDLKKHGDFLWYSTRSSRVQHHCHKYGWLYTCICFHTSDQKLAVNNFANSHEASATTQVQQVPRSPSYSSVTTQTFTHASSQWSKTPEVSRQPS